jgi:hypothetical protein
VSGWMVDVAMARGPGEVLEIVFVRSIDCPRLLGWNCGCWRGRDEGGLWRYEPCERHEREMREDGVERVLGL